MAFCRTRFLSESTLPFVSPNLSGATAPSLPHGALRCLLDARKLGRVRLGVRDELLSVARVQLRDLRLERRVSVRVRQERFYCVQTVLQQCS